MLSLLVVSMKAKQFNSAMCIVYLVCKSEAFWWGSTAAFLRKLLHAKVLVCNVSEWLVITLVEYQIQDSRF